MIEPKWINRKALEILQGQSIAMFGGLPGLRDSTLLESALARPQQLFTFSENPSLAGMAAAYAYGLGRNHPFVDGNQRAGLLAVLVFLEINDYALVISNTQGTVQAVQIMEAVASGELSEEQLTGRIEQRCSHIKE